ncbi:MAG: sulfotransferase domain-containing protein [Candidatus Competibacteraceae bacterium]|nr:sulfotransferase domain-containing protein [Candidatus Competibacteraceae bacterium]
MHMIFKRVLKWLVRAICKFLPEEQAHQLERWRRGREEFWKYNRCEYIFASYGKSGRTWVRVMISRYYQLVYKLPDNILMGFDNYTRLNKDIPKMFFTHDNYIKDYTGDADTKRPFYDKPVVLLARDPRDVAVSQFFQWKFRIKPSKVAINNYPPRGSDISLFDFVMGDNGGGMGAMVDYLNLWAKEADKVSRFHLLRYEDLRANTHEELRRLLDFMQVNASEEQVAAAVEYSSYENMKKMESRQQFRLSGGRMMPRDKDNPDSYKVRRAKVGGYRDYFTDEEVAAIDQRLAETLDPVFGYR